VDEGLVIDGPAPFVHRMICREACPDEVKEYLGTLSGPELCFQVVSFVGICIAAMFTAKFLLDALKDKGESRCR
jgi:hypothetical protein